MKNLSLDDNQITTIPDSIVELTQLTRLSLVNNQITKIPQSIENLTNLVNLDLTDNNTLIPPVSLRTRDLIRIGIIVAPQIN